jgi:hypothetical protein
MESVLKKLEDEYRFWMVETLKMGRGIERMEEEIEAHGSELGEDRAADLNRRLAYVRAKHHDLEERVLTIRQRLEELRERINAMPEFGGNR